GATPGPQGRGRAAPNTHADSGGPAPQGQAAVPGPSPGRSRYASVPSSVAIQRATGSPPPREGPVRHGSRVGRVVRRFLLLRVRGLAGVGRTWDGAWAPSPYSLRQPRADLVLPPAPPPGRGSAGGLPRSARESGTAGVPSKRRAAGAAAEDTRRGLVVQ